MLSTAAQLFSAADGAESFDTENLMFGRFCTSCIVLGVLFCSALPAKAQWFSNFFSQCKADYHRNHAWPEPMVYSDRISVAVPIGMQVNKGWCRQTLLCEHHFEDNGTRLNQAGEMHVKYILTQVPARYRTIFVQRSLLPDVTAERVNSVQQAVMRMQPSGEGPQVVESDMTNDGIPADGVDTVFKKWLTTQPDPRLPAPQGDTASSK